jgi:hypothetical protein
MKRNWNYIKALLEQVEQANRKGILQEHALNVVYGHDTHDQVKK